ncbi:hypothetical protein [Mycolicibacterium brisbanense]|uniref:hypothetical protein n=1 Tax=Mycolicibacterium brisbanense TaxID=146020 RepID=UPI00079FE811|nr:hypothetical protein [Mycolicibacterium brisbanense]MCV7161187.1 hypothetical protein [Mycolicibacterium brisbanense]
MHAGSLEQTPVGVGQRPDTRQEAGHDLGEPCAQLLDRHPELHPDVVLAWTPVGSPREDELQDATLERVHDVSLE